LKKMIRLIHRDIIKHAKPTLTHEDFFHEET
jgi:hypothetical protein